MAWITLTTLSVRLLFGMMFAFRYLLVHFCPVEDICGWLQAEPRSRSAWWTLRGDLGWLPPVECLIAGRVASVVSVLWVSHGWQAAWVPTGPTVEIHRSDR